MKKIVKAWLKNEEESTDQACLSESREHNLLIRAGEPMISDRRVHVPYKRISLKYKQQKS